MKLRYRADKRPLTPCRVNLPLNSDLGVSGVAVLFRWLPPPLVFFAGVVAWGVPWLGGVASNVWCLLVRCVWSVRVLPSGLTVVG